MIFALIMGTAAFVGLLFFPKGTRHIGADDAEEAQAHGKKLPPLGAAVWFSIVAIALMNTAQAITLSFFQQVGEARGFSLQMITISLVIYGVVIVFTAPIAALLEKKFAAIAVVSTVPVLQAVFSLVAMHTHNHVFYTIAGAMMAFTIIFVHTFAFGLLARLDPTGRAVAGTPAMLMVGSAVAPFVGGTLLQFVGFEAISYAAVVFVLAELFCFNQTRRIVNRANQGEMPVSAEA